MNQDDKPKAPKPRWRFDEPGVLAEYDFHTFSERYQLGGDFLIAEAVLLKILEEIGIVVDQVEDLFLKTISNGETSLTIDRKAFIYRLRELGAYEDDLKKHFNSYMTHNVELMMKDIQLKKESN